MHEFDPLTTLERMAARWWWVALALIAGGLLGYGSTFALKPVYEARAELYVNMNEAQFAVDKHLAYVDVKEREAAMAPVAALLYAADIVDAVDLAAQQNGVTLDTENFEFEFTLNRIYTRWLLIVRRDDAEEAAALANAWAQTLLDALQAAHAHAISAQAIELELFTLNQCFSQNDFAAANQCAGAHYADAAAFESDLVDLNARYQTELTAARGLDYTLDFRFERPATVPTTPSLNRPGILSLAGALIGLILGVLAAASLPAKKAGA